MRYYPVSIDKDTQGQFQASLIDMPDGPKGYGATETAALRQLTDRIVPALNALAARGRPLAPSEVADRPYIGVSPMIPIQPAQPAQPQAASQLLNYGWTPDNPRGGA